VSEEYTDLCAHDFAYIPGLWHQPRLVNVICAWSRILRGINPSVRPLSFPCVWVPFPIELPVLLGLSKRLYPLVLYTCDNFLISYETYGSNSGDVEHQVLRLVTPCRHGVTSHNTWIFLTPTYFLRTAVVRDTTPYSSQKCPYTSISLHVITCQKTSLFTVTAIRTSNFTYHILNVICHTACYTDSYLVTNRHYRICSVCSAL
jgi:hypothetical protein